MAQAGLRLLPERPVYAVGDLVVALGVYNARKLMRRDGNLPMFAYGVGKSHDLVSPSIEGVYHKHAARRLDRPFTYSGEPNYLIQLLKIVDKLVGVGCGHNYLYRYMNVCS